MFIRAYYINIARQVCEIINDMKQERDGCVSLVDRSISLKIAAKESLVARERELIKLIDQNLTVHICVEIYIYIYISVAARS